MKAVKLLFSIRFLLIIAIFLFLLVIYDRFNEDVVSDSFFYGADVISRDSLFDEEKNEFSTPIVSFTRLTYQANGFGKGNDVVGVFGRFVVRGIDKKIIAEFERKYLVRKKDGKHIDREGYLLAPRGLKEGEGYTYWHINYDTPVVMEYVGEEQILGLNTFVYEQSFKTDQTKDLTHLPGVPEERGVILDVVLKTWIDPKTGWLIKYEDDSKAWYYDIETGERTSPWNFFNNRLTPDSIQKQVSISRQISSFL